jgi:hypothetical protein
MNPTSEITNAENTPSNLHNDLSQAQTMLYSDKPLSPKMISSLMHVGASLESTYHHETEREESAKSSVLYTILVALASLIFALVIGVLFLYINHVGPFYIEGSTPAF